MRRYIIYVVLLMLQGIWAGDQKVDIATEKEAIKAAIQHEMDAYRTLDYEGYVASWVHEPYIVHPGIGTNQIVGWNSLREVVKNNMETREEEPDKNRSDEATASNFDIHLDGNIAYVIYDESGTGIIRGEPYAFDSRRQVKYLVKKDGEWRLVAIFIDQSEASLPE